jgi:SAM-dependent methyltransferase
VDANESEELYEELSRLRERIAAYERSRWWRLHPRFLLRRAVEPGAPQPRESIDADALRQLRHGAQQSAAIVVPFVQTLVSARTVIDVGGGEGRWAQAFAELGVQATSVDSIDPESRAPDVRHVRHDLREPFLEAARFDLAVCLEVAEHLDASAGDRLIETLCSLAPVVLFSAAIPGQGGDGHLNEQWPAYWVERFEACGYRCSGALRWRFWDDDRIESWYRQNLLFAAQDPRAFPEMFATAAAEPWPVVHPTTFARARRSLLTQETVV